MTQGEQITPIDELHEQAIAATGLTDFGDERYLGGLRALIDSYNTEAELNAAGAARFSELLVSILRARLRTQDSFKAHPEYRDQPIVRPLFVTGLPRTGTTALHRLLCLDPASQGLEHWLTDAPQPRPPRDTWADNID